MLPTTTMRVIDDVLAVGRKIEHTRSPGAYQPGAFGKTIMRVAVLRATGTATISRLSGMTALLGQLLHLLVLLALAVAQERLQRLVGALLQRAHLAVSRVRIHRAVGAQLLRAVFKDRFDRRRLLGKLKLARQVRGLTPGIGSVLVCRCWRTVRGGTVLDGGQTRRRWRIRSARSRAGRVVTEGAWDQLQMRVILSATSSVGMTLTTE